MKSRVLLFVAALALAGLGAAAIMAYVSGADERAVAGKRAVEVLVAAKAIPAGTSGERLRTGGYTERVRMPADTVPADALGALNAETDALAVTAEIKPRQLLLRGLLGRPQRTTGGLSVPDGKLAVTVEVTVAAGVAGYVRPGTQVAVFDTFNVLKGRPGVPSGDRLAESADNNRSTRVLLPRVQVLAVGQRPAAVAEEAEAKADVGRTMPVTVAVNQAEAERLVHAAQTGTLYLGLLTDSADVRPGPGVDNPTLFR